MTFRSYGDSVGEWRAVMDDANEAGHAAAVKLAQAGLCSHGGHGWDGETCDDIPAPDDGEVVPGDVAERLWQDAYEAFHGQGDYAIGNQD